MRGEVTTSTLCCLHSLFSQSLNKHCSVPSTQGNGSAKCWGQAPGHTPHCTALRCAAALHTPTQCFGGTCFIQSKESEAKKEGCVSWFLVIHNLDTYCVCGYNTTQSVLSTDTKAGLCGANGCFHLIPSEKQREDILDANGES